MDDVSRETSVSGEPLTDDQYGLIAYEAYGNHADWTTYNGHPMPSWSDLGDEVRSHWAAAARAMWMEWQRRLREGETHGA